MTTRSVITAIQLVETLAGEKSLGLSDLARRLDLSKATALRLLRTLEVAGWVQQYPAPSREWRVGDRLAWLGRTASTDTSLREVALDSMNQLQLATRETVHLAARHPDHLVLVERLDSPHELRAFFSLGTMLPFHASATGLAYLAALPDDEVAELLDGSLEPSTKLTLTDRSEILKEIDAIRARGYSSNSGGLVDGIASVGAAVVSGTSGPVGAVSVSGPMSRLTKSKRSEFGPLVAQAAYEISRKLSR